MPRRERARVLHMLEAAREAIFFLKDRSRNDLHEDRVLALALVKCIEIVGEAAAGMDREARERYPDIPWTDMVGMRNRLIHGYFEIDMDRVWDTITDDLPQLIAQLEAIEFLDDPPPS